MTAGPERGHVLVVGCGTSLRRDDQIGLRIAEVLAGALLPSEVQVKTAACPCTDLLDDLASRQDLGLLVVVDAAVPAADQPPGSWRRIDYRREPHRIRMGDRSNTHGLGPEAALEIAKHMDVLPPEVWVYVVAIGDDGVGTEMTAAVAEVVGGLSSQIYRDVKAWLGERGAGGA